jgi:hypothetical protein
VSVGRSISWNNSRLYVKFHGEAACTNSHIPVSPLRFVKSKGFTTCIYHTHSRVDVAR